MQAEKWDIQDQFINSLAITEAVFGEEYSDLTTHQQVDFRNVQILQQITQDDFEDKDFENLAPPITKLPDTDFVIPPEDISRLQADQLRTLKRSPTDTNIRTVTLLDSIGQEIVPNRKDRDSILLINNSTQIITIAARQLDLLFPTKCATLGPGASISLDTESAFWGLSNPIGATIQVFETYWDDDRLRTAEKEARVPIGQA